VYPHSSLILYAYFFQSFCSLFVHKLEFSIFCFAFHYQHLLHGVMLLYCVVCCHQHLLFIEHNLTNNNICSRIVLCKFWFSSPTFLFFGLWHFKQLSFKIIFHFFLLCFTIYIFFLLYYLC
jgi:hypothetical protein